MTVKQWLSRARFCDKEISTLQAAVEKERDRLTSITATLDGDTVTGTHDPHKFDYYAALTVELESKAKELYKTKAEVTEAIMQVKDQRYRQVLLLRYVSCYTWEHIAFYINYSYMQTCRLHGDALQAIEPIIRERGVL